MNFRGGKSGNGGLRNRSKVSNAVVDLTPLIDVTFQLLIFFLLTASFRNESAFRLDLPKASNQEPVVEQQSVTIGISEDGRFELEHEIVDLQELEKRLCSAAQSQAVSVANIKADKNTRHEFVVQSMEVARGCGLKKLNIVGKQ